MDILINESGTTIEADVKHSRTGGKQWTINARHSSSGIPRELNCRVLQAPLRRSCTKDGRMPWVLEEPRSLDSFLEINPLTLIGHVYAQSNTI